MVCMSAGRTEKWLSFASIEAVDTVLQPDAFPEFHSYLPSEHAHSAGKTSPAKTPPNTAASAPSTTPSARGSDKRKPAQVKPAQRKPAQVKPAAPVHAAELSPTGKVRTMKVQLEYIVRSFHLVLRALLMLEDPQSKKFEQATFEIRENTLRWSDLPKQLVKFLRTAHPYAGKLALEVFDPLLKLWTAFGVDSSVVFLLGQNDIHLRIVGRNSLPVEQVIEIFDSSDEETATMATSRSSSVVAMTTSRSTFSHAPVLPKAEPAVATRKRPASPSDEECISGTSSSVEIAGTFFSEDDDDKKKDEHKNKKRKSAQRHVPNAMRTMQTAPRPLTMQTAPRPRTMPTAPRRRAQSGTGVAAQTTASQAHLAKYAVATKSPRLE